MNDIHVYELSLEILQRCNSESVFKELGEQLTTIFDNLTLMFSKMF